MSNSIPHHRIEWVDCAKGIAMLFTLIGHTVYYPPIGDLLRGAIYSFHMPLFFILSGYTMSFSGNLHEWANKVKKSIFRLLLPTLITFIATTYLNYILQHGLSDLTFIYSQIPHIFLAILGSSAGSFSIGSLTFDGVGIAWFLITLFLSKNLFDLLHLLFGRRRVFFLLTVTILSFSGVLISKFLWPPLSLDLSLSVLLFICSGYLIRSGTRSFINFSTRAMLFSLILLGGSWCCLFLAFFRLDYLELAVRNYPLFPLCYLVAILGSCSVFAFSKIFLVTNFPGNSILKFIGFHSMALLIIHQIDFSFIQILYHLTDSTLIRCIVRLIVDLSALYLVVFFRHFATHIPKDAKHAH